VPMSNVRSSRARPRKQRTEDGTGRQPKEDTNPLFYVRVKVSRSSGSVVRMADGVDEASWALVSPETVGLYNRLRAGKAPEACSPVGIARREPGF
jgi:hypothetical protein